MKLTDFIDFSFIDVIDILLVAFLLLYLYKLLKGTVAINIFIGIVIIYLIWRLTDLLNMDVLSNLLGKFISVGFFALIVVFQQEIRKFLHKQPTIENVISLKTVVMGPSQVRLSVEVEFHGTFLMDRDRLKEDIEKIKSSQNPAPVLIQSGRRLVRLLGTEINRLEEELHGRFPSLSIIDIEVN